MGNISTSFSSDDAVDARSIAARPGRLHDSASTQPRGSTIMGPMYRLVDRNEQALNGFQLVGDEVLLHVYDLRFQIFGRMGTLAGAFHTGIGVHAKEYSFGFPIGAYRSTPLSESCHVYRSSIVLGRVCLSDNDVFLRVQALAKSWPGRDYNCFGKNCNGFCAALAETLGVGLLPPWVDRLSRMANEVTGLANALTDAPAAAATPAQGPPLADMDELMDTVKNAATSLLPCETPQRQSYCVEKVSDALDSSTPLLSHDGLRFPCLGDLVAVWSDTKQAWEEDGEVVAVSESQVQVRYNKGISGKDIPLRLIPSYLRFKETSLAMPDFLNMERQLAEVVQAVATIKSVRTVRLTDLPMDSMCDHDQLIQAVDTVRSVQYRPPDSMKALTGSLKQVPDTGRALRPGEAVAVWSSSAQQWFQDGIVELVDADRTVHVAFNADSKHKQIPAEYVSDFLKRRGGGAGVILNVKLRNHTIPVPTVLPANGRAPASAAQRQIPQMLKTLDKVPRSAVPKGAL